MTDDQPNYLCNDDDLNSLTDYFNAALAGEESKSRLRQMWEQEIGIIKATRMSAITMQQQEQEYFLVTEGELDQIKNDCAFPETLNCDGCEYAGDFDSTKASGVGCMFKGANVLIDEVMKRPLLKEHDVAIRNAVLDGLGVLRGEDARRFNEQLDHPEPLTPEARDLVMQAKEIAKKERMALDDRDRLIRKNEREIIFGKTNWEEIESGKSFFAKIFRIVIFSCDDEGNLNSDILISKLKTFEETLCLTTPSQENRDYQCGDNCHGECSGECDGKIHCPETESEKRGNE